MILAPSSDDFKWDDEEASYYDDNVIYVEDDDSLCDIVCIEKIRPNPLQFSVIDGRVVSRRNPLEVDPSEYL